MFSENEVVMFFIAIGVVIVCVRYYPKIKKTKDVKLLLWGFFVFFAACNFTIIEGFIFPRFFNLLEHLSYLISSICIAIWCYKAGLNSKSKI